MKFPSLRVRWLAFNQQNRKFHEISRMSWNFMNFMKFSWISWNFMNFMKFLWIFMKIHELSRNSWNFMKIAAPELFCHHVSCKFHDISWHVRRPNCFSAIGFATSFFIVWQAPWLSTMKIANFMKVHDLCAGKIVFRPSLCFPTSTGFWFSILAAVDFIAAVIRSLFHCKVLRAVRVPTSTCRTFQVNLATLHEQRGS